VLDVAGLKSKAVALNNSFFLQKMQQLPLDYSIDYVHAQGDLSVVDRRFGQVLSSHCLVSISYSLTHSLTPFLHTPFLHTHTLTGAHSQPPQAPATSVVTYSLTHSLTHSFTHSLTHSQEHTVNLLKHLQQVSSLLLPGGRFYLIIPRSLTHSLASTSSSPTSARPSTTSAHSPLSLMCYSLTYKTLPYTHFTL
jgi:hypothetical protein